MTQIITNNRAIIPTDDECLALLAKYDTPHHIILHSKKVQEIGQLLGEGLLRKNYGINLALISASCLLHDIGKYPCILDGGGYHDLRGEKILLAEGFDAVARIVVQHVVLRTSSDGPVREEHIVYYADKRVVHDKIVSLEDRFIYLEQTYGKSREALRRLQIMKEETLRIENEIFLLLDFQPEDIITLLESSNY